MFNKGGRLQDRDLYVFCANASEASSRASDHKGEQLRHQRQKASRSAEMMRSHDEK